MGGKGSGRRPRKKAAVPQSTVKPTKAPATLDAAGKTEWKRLIDILDRIPELMKEADWDLVGYLAQSIRDYEKATAVIKRKGMTETNRESGVTRARPEVGIKNKALEEIVKIKRELGITPQGRRLLEGTKPPKEKANPLTEYLAKRGIYKETN